MLKKFFDGKIPQDEDDSAEGLDVKSKAVETVAMVWEKIEVMRVNEAIEITLQFVRSINKYLETKAPWKLAKEEPEIAGKVLFTAVEALRVSAVLLSPIMPITKSN